MRPRCCSGNNTVDAIVYNGVFEQSILVNHGSSKPWSLFASLSAELVAVSLMILIPLAYTDHLPEFHWKSVTVAPTVRPIQPVENIARASNVFTQTIFKQARTILPIPPRRDAIDASTVSAPMDLPPGFVGSSDGVATAFNPIGNVIGKTPAAPPYAPPVNKTVLPPPSGPIRVSIGVQLAKLQNRVMPVYPQLAKSARISGVVHLIGIIGKDGKIRNLQVIDGHPLLTRAALDAVSQWIYKPTLLNNEAVEVIAPIDVNFTLSQ
jgi:periplasmic protein TonB